MTGEGRILVTGAGRGIGRAIAERFWQAGWTVGMYDVDEASVAAAARGRERLVHGALDVRDDLAWRAVLTDFCGDGPLDVLVNNAGVLASGPFTSMTIAEHRRMVEVNVMGVVNGCVEAYPHLRRPGGLLLNLCSASALYGQASLATYGATKSAVKSLTEALDLEWEPHGVRVRSLLPLFVDTDMIAGEAGAISSVRRLGVRITPDDVAAAAWKVAHEKRRPLRSPHRPVGLQTHLLTAASAISPMWTARLVAKSIAV